MQILIPLCKLNIYPIANLHVQYSLYFVFPLCYLKWIYIINYMNKYLKIFKKALRVNVQ